MKPLLLILLATLPVAVFSQTADNYSIKGTLGTKNAPAKVFLVYQAGGKNVIDSSVLANGAFIFHGNVAGPLSALLVVDPTGAGFSKLTRNSDALNFYLDKADMLISSPDSIAKAMVTGSKVNDDNTTLKENLKLVDQKAKALIAEANAAPDAQQINPIYQDQLQKRYQAIQLEQQSIIKKFITGNPQSFVSLAALASIAGQNADLNELDGLFKSLSPEVRATEQGVAFAAGLETEKATAIGAIAPDFTQADTSGKPLTLSSLRGKYVLLDFWASWCSPCRRENPFVVAAYNDYKAKNFTILSVSLDQPNGKAAWLKAIKDDGLTWYQVSDLNYWNNAAARLYNIDSIPQNFLIDPSGKIIAKNLIGRALLSKLADIFKM